MGTALAVVALAEWGSSRIVTLDAPPETTAGPQRPANVQFVPKTPAELPPPEPDIMDRAVDALIGLAAFPAEQALAMSLSKKGLDLDRLWERKRQAVEQAPGLTIWRGGETFAESALCDPWRMLIDATEAGDETLLVEP